MASKDHSPRVGRASPLGRDRQEPLWSESESSGLFDPDRAFEEARARVGAGPESSESSTGTERPEDGPEPQSSSEPKSHGGDELPVPILDDAEEEEDQATDTHIQGSSGDPADARFETADDPRIPDGQAAFKIGEVARIVGVRPYVLRYWESELDFVQPEKTEAGQRRFGREDVATLLQVKRLRHDAGLTMAQTRALIAEGRGSEVGGATADKASSWILRDAEAQTRVRGQLLRMREAVVDLLHAVDDEGDEHHG